jgi:tyramine---L-glutamate ligase
LKSSKPQKSYKTKQFSTKRVGEPLRLLVYEHVSGGGFAEEALPSGVLSEGFAMLRTLTEDFKASGHVISTTLDARIAKMNPPIPADCSVPVTSKREAQTKLFALSEQVDAICVIAPETDGTLQSLVELVEQTDASSLNCQATAIAKVSNKAGFHEVMRRLGVPLPETVLLSVTDSVSDITETVRGDLGFPVVFKPVDGVSCDGISVARDEKHVAGAVGKIKAESESEQFLVQKLVEGDAASVTVLSTGSKVVPVSLNLQEVELETPDSSSSYLGGAVPFDHPLGAKAFEVAEKIVESVSGLRGYVGVDFVLSNEEAVAVDVNPRLTTSYVGLRRVANFNPAQAIVNAVTKQELPSRIECSRCTVFSKVAAPSPTVDVLHGLYGLDEVLSPPFPVSSSGSSALVAVYGATFKEASLRFREAKKRVLTSITGGR